jgi:hypothetical protein
MISNTRNCFLASAQKHLLKIIDPLQNMGENSIFAVLLRTYFNYCLLLSYSRNEFVMAFFVAHLKQYCFIFNNDKESKVFLKMAKSQ